MCVAVCPTGIDIREGPQIGCITCALCIDACDKVMGEIGRPRGLIDYITLENAEREKAGGRPRPAWKALLRPRTIVYLTVWGAIGLAMVFALSTRAHTAISAASDRNPPYMLLSDGSVRNAYTLKLRNMEDRPRALRVVLHGLRGAAMWTDEIARKDAARALTFAVPADATASQRVYVIAPPSTASQEFEFEVLAQAGKAKMAETETRFSAPGDE
jgi:polyferredoxin